MASKNIPVNGWPQLKDLEAVQPILDRLDKIEAWKRTVKEETFTGGEITIPNALALPARSLITEINAIQDLHGYDKPWVGGAGKNKLPNNYTGTGTAGVTAVNNSDGSIKLNGTASTTGYMLLNRYEANAFKDIPLKISINGVSGLHLYVNGVDANNRFVASVGATTSETTITPTYSNYVKIEVGLQLDNGTAFNGTFYPMLRLASESDNTWQPYSNICPISGRTAVAVERIGQNLWDEDYAGIAQSIKYTPVYVGDGSFTLRTTAPRWDNSGCVVFLLAGSASSGASNADHGAYNGSPRTQTAVNGYVTVAYRTVGDIDPRDYDTELIKTSEITTVTIQLGQTVYGADINWDTGAMTVKTVCPDLGGLTWTADATGVANKNRFYADLSPLAVVADSVNLTSISSQYTLLAPGGTYSANADGYTITAASKIYIYDEALSSTTAADFKTAMSGVQVEYTLATPTTIQLTPEQLQMLKGYNRITLSDGYGTIELKALTGANWS